MNGGRVERGFHDPVNKPTLHEHMFASKPRDGVVPTPAWRAPKRLRYDQPPVAPLTIPKGPVGQRKQSIISWST